MVNLIEYINKIIGESYDVSFRKFTSDNKKIVLVFIDYLCDTASINQNIIAPLINRKGIKIQDIIEHNLLANYEVGKINDYDEAIEKIISGYVILVFEKSKQILYVNSKVTLTREIAIPPNENVFKGPREGFNGHLETNLALVRTIIKNPELTLKKYTIGSKSNTTVILMYMKDTAPTMLVKYVKNKLENNKIQYVLDSHYIGQDFETKKSFFDTVGYSEKPDVIASNILQGKVAIFVDGSPMVISLPYFYFENFHSPDDYYLNRYVATVSRLTKFVSFLIGIIVPSFYVAMTTFHFNFIPMVFIQRLSSARSGVPVPTFIELLLMMFFFFLSREAAIRLPKTIGPSLSIVAGLVLGQTTVEAGLASQITVVIAGIYAVATFVNSKIATPIYVWSIILVFCVTILGFPGFILGFFIFITHIANLSSCDYPYAFPFATSKSYKMKDLLWVSPLKEMSKKILSEDDINES